MLNENYLLKKSREVISKINYDNGLNNRYEDEKISLEYAEKIKDHLIYIQCNNFEITNINEFIDDLAFGYVPDISKKYDKIKGFKELESTLNEYFDLIQ